MKKTLENQNCESIDVDIDTKFSGMSRIEILEQSQFTKYISN